MNKFDITNQSYLLSEQYKDASLFNTRLNILQSLSGNPFDYRWIFDHIRMAPACRVLELGCGPGYLWQKNEDRIPADWEITLSDFSPGMLKNAQENLSQTGHSFTFQVIDAQAIPFEAAHFDRVIANCMLYHVPDRPRALSEIRRVLKPAGYFYATTFSKEIFSEFEPFMRETGIPSWLDTVGFSLEDGREQLAPFFSQIQLYQLTNKLVITETEPLVAMIRTGTPNAKYDEKQFQHLRQLVQQELAKNGSIQAIVNLALFEASGPE